MYSILIADDESIERDYLKSIIQKHPSKYSLIGEAENGKQVVNMAIDNHPNIIIMDIVMPLINGIEASKIIKENNENIIIILNSAYSEFEYAKEAINYDLDAYLLKPASEDEVLGTINSLIKKKRLNSEIEFNTSNSNNVIDIEYPYNIVDKINDALLTSDSKLLVININNYLDFIKSRKFNLDEHRLFIVNSLFSIMKSVKEIFPKDICYLLNCEKYLDKISHTSYWNEIYNSIEEFFNILIITFKNFYLNSQNISDIIQNYIDNNFNREISLNKLSDMYHFSPSYLSKKFHEDKNCTINDYINIKRVNFSKYLLINSSLTIKKIAMKSGFSNVTHFNRVFKKITCKVPTEYKLNGE